MHELGLDSIDALPQAVLVDTLQRLCLAAGTPDATGLPAHMVKHMRASEALPELEKFINTVCEVCRPRSPVTHPRLCEPDFRLL